VQREKGNFLIVDFNLCFGFSIISRVCFRTGVGRGAIS
jgi:hypothetical protein